MEGELEVSSKIAAFTEESQHYLTAKERVILQVTPKMNIVLNGFTFPNHLDKDLVVLDTAPYISGAVLPDEAGRNKRGGLPTKYFHSRLEVTPSWPVAGS